MQKDIRVRKISRGTVIDHISAGQALNVLKILGITKEHPKTTLTVAINVPSKRIGVKDIVKVEGLELHGEDIDKISLIAPEATINIVRDYKVIEKKKVEIPEKIEGMVKCANPNCITNFEIVKTKFIVEKKHPVSIMCLHCERVMMEKDIVRQF